MCIAWLWVAKSPCFDRDSQEVSRYRCTISRSKLVSGTFEKEKVMYCLTIWETQVSIGILKVIGEIRYFVCSKTAYVPSLLNTVIDNVSG